MTYLRDEFPILARKTYLNTCSLGALSRRSRAAVGRFLDLWEDMGASAWYELWLGELDATRKKFARLVHAHDDEIAILPNVSSALASLASALDYASRPKVVTNALDFPTIPYQWRVQPGCEVVAVPTPDGIRVPTDAMVGAIDERTAAVATSHVFFTSGYIQDVKRISAAAKRAGALSIIDAYHGAGQLPVDVKDIGCDAYISGGLKWLLGGPGIAYLYVSREAQARLTPTFTGWFAHERQFDFDPSRFEFRTDARKFEAGTPSVSAVYAGGAGLDIILEVGSDKIRRRTDELATDLYERFADAGYTLKSPVKREERAGIVMVELADPRAVVAKLAKDNIIVDSRPGRLRVSPYFYNTEEENERVVEAVRRAAPAK
ncbi:MAG: aminotransferase class V-fold PLP-dependent enzyme [Thermoplasmatota archaeon]